MAKLQRAVTCYNSGSLSASVRAQLVAMGPKYLDGCTDADGAWVRDNLPGSFPLRYFNLTDLPNYSGGQRDWGLARAATNGIATPESVLMHFLGDTVISITGTLADGTPNVTRDYLIPGFGAGSAGSLAAARVPLYYHPDLGGTFPRVLTNFSTAAVRQVWREYVIEQVLSVPYATGKYPLGVWLDNATDTLFNVDAVSMSSKEDGRDVWGVYVQAGSGTWGASGGAGNYVYRIVPSTSLGDGISSKDHAVTITNTTQQVELDWSPSGTGTYKVYRKPAAASWTVGNWRIGTVVGGTQFIDTGAAPIGGSGGPSRAGELVEAPAGVRFKSPEFDNWKWNSGHGLWIRELKDLVATGPGWLGGRACKVVANTANHPGLPTSFGTRYTNFNGTGAPVADGVFREFCGSPIRNYELAEPFSMYTAFQAAAAAGMDVWETGYNYGVTYPSGTATTFDRLRTSFDIMSGIIGLAWLVRSSTSYVQGYANTWSPADAEWQHNTWPLWNTDLGAPLGPPAVIASGTVSGLSFVVYGREFVNGYVTVRFRGSSSESMAATLDVPVTLPAGNWLPVVDLNGTTGPQQAGPFQHVNGQAYLFLRAGTPPADTTAPAAVTLAVTGATSTTLTLGWTAPGDDGAVGQAASYEMRRSLSPITAGNFAAATLVAGLPAPALAGTAQQVVVTGLQPGATWYFAMRTADEVPNWSTLSNSVAGQTTPPPADVTPPGKITDLAIVAHTIASLTAEWTAPGDDLGVGSAASYQARVATAPIMAAAACPIMTNGSLDPSHTPQVTAKFFQDVGASAPASVAPQAIAAPGSVLHFAPGISAAYAACFAACCGAHYQRTAVGGGANQWNDISTNTAGAPDGAFGASTAATVIAGNLMTGTFTRAVVLVNLSLVSTVTYPGGSIPGGGTYAGGTLAAGGQLIVQGTGYGTTNTPGMFPQRGGILWALPAGTSQAQAETTLALWATVIVNNAQTEFPAGVTTTMVANLRAARAAMVPSNPAMMIYESHNGLGVFVDGAGAPSVYFPAQQRIHAFCQLDPLNRWIQEGGAPLKVGTSWYFNLTDQRLQEFFASEVLASVARCGADGAFGDEWHTIHPSRVATHPTVPQDAAWAAGLVRTCDIQNNNFDDLASALAQLPEPAGTLESHVFNFLDSGLEYWVAIRGVDEAGNAGPMSNVALGITDDLGPPTDVVDLSASSSSSSSATLTWTAPGDPLELGDYQPAWAYEIRRSTAPLNSGNFSAGTLVVQALAPANPGDPEALVVTGLAASTLYYFAMRAVDFLGNASGLSNVATVTTAAAADITGPAAVTNLAVSIPTQTSLRLTWTAPGDDGNTGTATAYDVRYSTAPITEANFSTRAQVSGLPTPAPAGTAEVKNVTAGLSSGTLYYFAIKAVDEAGNWSPISNLASGTTTAAADTTAPSTVSNLATTNPTSSSITLTWTAPGDDAAVGTATSYDIRYSTSPINAGNFAAATAVPAPPTPAVAGTAQSKIVTGLAPSTLYYFAIKASDEVPNTAAISNVPTGTTTGVVDATAPAAVTDLAVVASTPTSLTIQWTAPGDDASTGTAATYDVRISGATITSGNFGAATAVTGEPVPAVAGTVQSMVLTGLTPATTYYVAMKTADEVPNTSPISNVATMTTPPEPDVTAPAAIVNLAAPVGGRTQTTVTLQWTAPGDDGSSGVAAGYDVRVSTDVIDAGNFNAATSVPGAPAPAIAGTFQSMVVTGLVHSTLYYFAIKSVDEAGNWSAISNVPSRITLSPPVDTMPPGDVTDLAAVEVGPSSVSLSYTVTGDDGSLGLAAAVDLRYSLAPITPYNFSGATPATGEPAPAAPGTLQTAKVTGLDASTRYYFALRVLDEIGNGSALSNVVSVTTAGQNVVRLRVTFMSRARLRVEV